MIRAPIRDELEKLIARLQETKYSFANILDDLDGPPKQPEQPGRDSNPTHPMAGVEIIRGLLVDLSIGLSQLEDERDRLLAIRENLIGVAVPEANSTEKYPEIRQGDWRGHP
jgi:hypothetical protein